LTDARSAGLTAGLGRAGFASPARAPAECAGSEVGVDVRAESVTAVVRLASVVGRAAIVAVEFAGEQHVVVGRREASDRAAEPEPEREQDRRDDPAHDQTLKTAGRNRPG